LSKLVSKLEVRSRKLEKTSFEFPGRASIQASTTLNEFSGNDKYGYPPWADF